MRSFRPLSSLRSRLYIIILFALLPLAILLILINFDQRRLLTSAVHNDTLTLARLLAADQARTIRDARQLMATLANLPDVRNADAQICSARLADLLLLFERDYTGFGVVDVERNLLCTSNSSPGDLPRPVDLSERIWFTRTLESRNFSIGEYQIGASSNEQILGLGYPILSADNQIQSIIFAGLSLTRLNQLFANVDLPAGGELLAIDRSGTILSHYPEPDAWVGRQLSDEPLSRTIASQESGAAEVAGLDGVMRVYGFVLVPSGVTDVDTGLKIAIGVPSEVAFAEADRLLSSNLLALVAATVLVLVASVLLGNRFVVRQVQGLLVVAQRLREGDLSVRSDLDRSSGEFRQLAIAFNEMAEALGQRESERRQAQEETNAQRRLLSQTLSSIGDAVIATDAHSRITFMNAVAESLTGWRHNEAIDKPLNEVFNIFNEATAQAAPHPVERVLKEGVIVGLANHTVLRRADGTQIPIDDSAAPIRDRYGSIVGAVLVFRDITERRRSEDALRDSEERYRQLVEVSPDTIYIHSDNEIVFINPAGLALLRAGNESQIVGKRVRDIIHPDYREIVDRRIQHLHEGLPVPVEEEKFLRLDQTAVDVEVAAAPLVYQGRAAIQVMARDITQRKEAERRLQIQYAVTRALAESWSLDEIYQHVLQVVCEGVGWEMGLLWYLDQDANLLRHRSAWHVSDLDASVFESSNPKTTFAYNTGLPGRVWAGGKSVWIPDLAEEKNFARGEMIEQLGLRSAFALPIYSGVNIAAVVECFSKDIQQPAEALLQLLDAIGRQIGNFIERTRVEETLAMRARQQAIVAELGQHALTASNLSEVMTEAVTRIAQILRIPYTQILEIQPDGQTLLLRAGYGWKAGAIGHATVSTSTSTQAGYTLHMQQPVLVEDLRRETRFKGAPLLYDHGVVSGITVVISGRDKPYGVLCAHDISRRIFTQDDAHFMEAVANVLAAAITRVEDEGALKLSRDQLAIILEGVADGITALDADGRIVFVNDTATRMLGYPSRDAMLHLAFDEVMRKFDIFDELGKPLSASQLPVFGALQGIQNPPVLLLYRARDSQEQRWSITKATAVFNPRWQVELVVNIFQDVSGLKRAEQGQRLLAQVGDALSTLLNYHTRLASVPQVVVPQLADWCIVEVLAEDQSIQMMGAAHVDPNKLPLIHELRRRYSPNLGLAQGVATVLRTGRAELFEEVTDHLLATAVQNAEHERLTRELGVRSVMIVPMSARGRTQAALTLVHSTRRYNAQDLALAEEIARRAAVAVDNARLYESEQDARAEAEKANQLKMQFLAMISHELRTPLTSIKGFATTLLAEDVIWDAAHQRDFVETINQESDKLIELINQLLDLSQLGAGTLRILPVNQKLSAILETAKAQLETLTANHHLAIQMPRDLPPVRADARRIGQVLANLVSNAARYSPSHTRITIAASAGAKEVQVDVSDEGPGIPRQARDRVFEAFHRLSATDGDDMLRQGVGLGLAICKGLIEAHGGRIWVHDQNGSGTTISFTLPRAD